MSDINERQKRYRERHIENGSKRLDMLISKESSNQLTMLTLYGNVKKKHIIESLLEKEYNRLMNDEDSYFEKLVKDINKCGVNI